VEVGGRDPLIFNIYLEEAIKSNPRLFQLIKRGDLKPFADDLLLHLSSHKETLTVI